jgi:flavin reductase (DIM6/NTAB) family NADH-FMN oxidoreductase RutF
MSTQERLPVNNDPQKNLAAALGRITSGMFVLTGRQGEAETGMLGSWVQQCSFQPPRISVAVHPDRELARWLALGAHFTVNILDDSQTDMIAHFGKGFKTSAGDKPFEGLEIERLDGVETGPVLREALAFLICRVVARVSAGDHDLIVGEVARGEMRGEGHPMVHVRKSGLHY